MTNMTDTRRLFRNRFELYMDNNDSSGARVLDGSPLTLRELCNALAADYEPFPRCYNLDI